MDTTTTPGKEALTLYDADFFEWTQRTAQLILEGRFSEVDREHLAEEIADMGKRDRREVKSRIIVLTKHLLKCQAQPRLIKGSTWMATIKEQRRQLVLLLNDSPSLIAVVVDDLDALHADARQDAIDETGLAPSAFPEICPYSPHVILDRRFNPVWEFDHPEHSLSRDDELRLIRNIVREQSAGSQKS